jgi:hypothetical protein
VRYIVIEVFRAGTGHGTFRRTIRRPGMSAKRSLAATISVIEIGRNVVDCSRSD